MATTKLATLVIRTLAKPISLRIKEQARQHERFRGVCVSLAQFMYRSEVKLRTNILGESIGAHGRGGHIRPLSESKAIESGANILAEGFLFLVAAMLILGETWRSSRKEGRRREGVDVQLEELQEKIASLEVVLDSIREEEKGLSGKTDELVHVIRHVVEIGLRNERAGFSDLPPTPLVDLDSSLSSSGESGSILNVRSQPSPSESVVLSSLPSLSKTSRAPSPVDPGDAIFALPSTSEQELLDRSKP